MKKKKNETPIRLKLNSETVRLLNAADLAKVAGGVSDKSICHCVN